MKENAFTLIELLIVVAIIGILAAIAVPNFINAQIRAKVARVQSEEKSIRDAYTQYFMDRNAWPPHMDGSEAQHRAGYRLRCAGRMPNMRCRFIQSQQRHR